MEPFLQQIATAFYKEYQADIRQFTFVFPNRRAGLFFQKHLSEIIDKPIFSPNILSINDCFFNATTRNVADRTAELFRIFQTYREISKTDESFDNFFFWGEMLLQDFDEVDKYRINAAQLYKNLHNLREIESIFADFDQEQQLIIEKFWGHLLPVPKHETGKNFIAIWQVLAQLYEETRQALRAENLATEGMIFREISEQLEAVELPQYFQDKKFVFIGFNALNPCERTLFTELQKHGIADFYWDYDAAVLRLPENKASRFFEENMRNFPSKLTIKRDEIDFLEKKIELIAVPSSVGQVKEAYRLLNGIFPEGKNEDDWLKTAVVLPDESLLVPLLHSLPEQIGRVNVTMGFPLKATPVASLLDNIFELQRRSNAAGQFYHLTVSNILNHPYISKICGNEVQNFNERLIQSNAIYADADFFAENELLSTIFALNKTSDTFLPYLLRVLQALHIQWLAFAEAQDSTTMEADFIFQYFTTINRMNEVMLQSGSMDMGLETLIRLVRQLVGSISIPFEGEPLNGLQVMGMLETRGLDFDNLIITSFNEGVFPKKQSSNSFIPYNLRRAFGLPTDEHQDAIAAYNFYRLIQRTNQIFFIYDSRTEGVQTGEVSRFMHQLKYQYELEINESNLSYRVQLPAETPITIYKTDDVMKKLAQFTAGTPIENRRSLSASAINTYINCPLQFYFSYVERLREQDEITEGIEAAMFGTLLHYVMENLYKPYENKLLTTEILRELSKNTLHIDQLIRTAFAIEFFKKNEDETVELDGNYLLYAKILRKYIVQILKIDAKRAPFKYIESEKDLSMLWDLFDGTGKVQITGKIDRVDEKEGQLRILDYKTGRDELSFSSLEQAFEKNNPKRPKAVLQTFLYSELYLQNTAAPTVSPEVMKVRDVFQDDFSSQLKEKIKRGEDKLVTDYANDYRQDYKELLSQVLEEIFNPEIAFTQCENRDFCKWCAFQTICRREVKRDNF